MIGFDEALAAVARISREDLDLWIRRQWVRPQPEGSGWRFAEVDVARIALICELRDDLRLDDEAMPVVLSLLDQVYELRRRLRALGAAVAAQPYEVRDAVWAALSRRRGDE